MTDKILDFVKFKLSSKFNPSTATQITIIADSDIYTLGLQRQGGNLSDFRLTIVEKTDTSQKIRIAIEDVDSESTVNGKKQYVLNIKQSDSTNEMIGLANDDTGTNADANIIAGNVSSLSITEFSTDSQCNLVVGSAEYNVLESLFSAGTTVDTATANSGVTILKALNMRSDGEVEHGNSNFIGVANETKLATETVEYTTYGGLSTGHTGLTPGEKQYAETDGSIVETATATTVLIGRAQSATEIRVTLAGDAASTLTQLEVEDETSTAEGLVSGELLAQSQQASTVLFGVDAEASDAYVITLVPVPAAYYTGMKISFTANTANTGAATIDVNSLGAKTIVRNFNATLADGDIAAGQAVDLVYDGTNFQMTSPTSVDTSAINAPAIGFSTVFESSGRFGVNGNGDAAVFNTDGLSISTSAVVNKYRNVFMDMTNTAYNFSSGNVMFSTMIEPSNFGGANDEKVFAGIAASAPVNGVPHTSGLASFGFVFSMIGGTLNIYAMNANGSSNTNTLVGTFTNGTPYHLVVIRDGNASIKFYLNGALVATHTTNIPTVDLVEVPLFSTHNGGLSSNDIQTTISYFTIEKRA